MRGPVAALAVLAVWFAACATGCGAGSGSRAQNDDASPILLIGVDGLEWDVLVELLRAERLPVLAGLMQRGQYGYLETLEETFSPIIWTTVATGKPESEHGIVDFVTKDEQGNIRLLTNADRKTKAIWNILTDYERRVTTIGWWITYPVEPINGVMVAQTNTVSDERRLWKGTLLKGKPKQVYPPQRQNEMMAILDEVEQTLSDVTLDAFGRFPNPVRKRERKSLKRIEWTFRADATYHRIALKLLRERDPFDLMLMYYGGPDVVGHRFWHFFRPQLYKNRETPRPKDIENFRGMVPDYYVYVDRMIGELLAEAPPNVNVFVVSDHGMEPVDDKDRLFSAHHFDSPPGFFAAAGPAIKPNTSGTAVRELRLEDLETVGSVLDITPTLLALLRVPIANDMSGRVLAPIVRDAFEIARQPERVATHDSAEFLANRPQVETSDPGELERLEQLRNLGYVGDPSDDEDDGEEDEQGDAGGD